MFTFSQHISRDNSGEYYSAQVIPLDVADALYRQTQCGFGGDYATQAEAQAAADAWLGEMRASDFAAH